MLLLKGGGEEMLKMHGVQAVWYLKMVSTVAHEMSQEQVRLAGDR